MLITLYGPDSYRRLAKLKEIVDTYRGKYTGISYDRIDMVEPDAIDRLKNLSSTLSMFDPVRLVVIDNLLDHPSKKEIKEILKANTDTKELTLVINTAKKPPATYKILLEGSAKTQEFPALKGESLKTFIKQEAQTRGIKLDTQTTSLLVELFGSDTWGLITELDQIEMSANKGVEAKPSTDYFRLINTVKGGYSPKERLSALEIILSERKDEPARVFNTIAYRPSTEKEAQRFADYDVAIKSGKLEYEEVLLSLALGS